MKLLSVLYDPRLKGPHDIELVGDTAFIAGKWGAFSAVDVADPANPRVISVLDDQVDNAQTILPIGDQCLLGTNDLLSIDVSDRANFDVTARLSDPRINRINGMVRRDHIVYAANKSHQIDVFDVTDPTRPVLIDAYDSMQSGIQSPHDVALLGDHLITVDQKRDAELKIQVYRVWDGEPRSCRDWEVTSTIADPRLNGANRIAVADPFIYVACNSGDSLCAVGLQDGKGTLHGVVDTHDLSPCGIELGDGDLFVGAAAHAERFSLVDPANPKSVDHLCVFDNDLPLSPKQRTKGDAHDLVYRDGLLYVTGQNDDSLAIVSV